MSREFVQIQWDKFIFLLFQLLQPAGLYWQLNNFSSMGGLLPKIQRHKKSPLKNGKPITFMYSNMVTIKQIQDINKHYNILGKIGQGSSGTVYKATTLINPHLRAIKQIHKQNNQEGISSLMEMEFAILKNLDHPNIVKMYQILQSPTDVYIVTQLCEGEELFDVLMRVKQFPEKVAREILFQVVSALKHMHQHHFMHRDIKPQNIIYSEKTKTVKLIDLSSSIFFDSSEPVKRKRIGTSYYIAPEVLERCYNQKCDVWSLGVITYVLLSGEPPFGGESDIEILKKVLYGKLKFDKPIWKDVSVHTRTLIAKMMQRNIQRRLSMQRVMDDPWFKEYLLQREKEQTQSNYVLNALINMKKFKEVKEANIQNGILVFIINFVSQNENQKELVESFKALDLNGDGMLSLEEMTIGLTKYMRVSYKEAKIMAEHIFHKVDTNNSGFIDYSQFLVAASTMEVVISPENVDLAFDCFDQNKDGMISVKQFQQKLGKNISQNQYQQLIQEHDLNRDGHISREEFRQMMASLLQKS